MSFLHDFSIRAKLVFIIVLTSGTVIALTSLAFITFDRIAAKEAMVHKLRTLAQVIGNNSVSALDFDDQQAAEETLTALRAEPRVVAACIFREDGAALARYHRYGLDFAVPEAAARGERFTDDYLVVFEPIAFQGQSRGTIFLQSDLQDLRLRLQRHVVLVAAFSSVALLVALLMAGLLQQAISRPIQELARAAGDVSASQDYSVRAAPGGQDEVGTLVVRFNEMLTQIQARDRDLRRARDELGTQAEALQQELEGRQKAEAELEAQRILAQRGDRLRSLGEMAAGIAHELNQPLVGVRGLAEHTLIGLERGWAVAEERVSQRLERIIEQADRMVHIIQHVRLFAREAGKAETKAVQVDEVVQSSQEMLGAQFRAHGLELSAQLGGELPLVRANPFSLEEVLLNLLSNARDAVEERMHQEEDGFAPQVVTRTGADDGRVWIEVEDNGTGIPAEIVDKVFDPFFTTKDPDKGTGLGLAIARSILEEFDGELAIRSTPGQGTTVSLLLPVAARQEQV